jgi:hypothetical protein
MKSNISSWLLFSLIMNIVITAIFIERVSGDWRTGLMGAVVAFGAITTTAHLVVALVKK